MTFRETPSGCYGSCSRWRKSFPPSAPGTLLSRSNAILFWSSGMRRAPRPMSSSSCCPGTGKPSGSRPQWTPKRVGDRRRLRYGSGFENNPWRARRQLRSGRQVEEPLAGRFLSSEQDAGVYAERSLRLVRTRLHPHVTRPLGLQHSVDVSEILIVTINHNIAIFGEHSLFKSSLTE